jgi:hypothetical protein
MAYVPGETQTLEDVKATLQEAKEKGTKGADVSMARLMANHGNLTDEAREYARNYKPTE